MMLLSTLYSLSRPPKKTRFAKQNQVDRPVIKAINSRPVIKAIHSHLRWLWRGTDNKIGRFGHNSSKARVAPAAPKQNQN